MEPVLPQKYGITAQDVILYFRENKIKYDDWLTELLENAKLELYPKIKAWKDGKTVMGVPVIPIEGLDKDKVVSLNPEVPEKSAVLKNLGVGGEALKQQLEAIEKMESMPEPTVPEPALDDADGFKSFVPKDELDNWPSSGDIGEPNVPKGAMIATGTPEAPLYVSEHPKVSTKRKKRKHHAK